MPKNYKQSGFISAMLHTNEVFSHKDSKICSKCNQVRPMEDFSKDGCRSDGRQNTCKSCVGARASKLKNDKKIELDFFKNMMAI